VQDAKQRSVSALDKALNVLERLSLLDADIDLGSLAREVRLPKSTLLRLLTTLKTHNLIHQDERTRRFRLGWALIYLGRAANRAFSLVELAHPFLERLARQIGETANLVLLERNHAVYVDQVVSDSIIRGVPPVAARLGLHCTAAGKVLLSFQPPDRLERILTQIRLKALTAKTITDPARLRKALRRVRRQGYAVDDEESEIGGRCVGAPVRDREGRVIAAVSVVGPSSRFTRATIPGHIRSVLAVTGEISRSLGYRDSSKKA
jgi:IclR family KDG regulon transcriptional repressor